MLKTNDIGCKNTSTCIRLGCLHGPSRAEPIVGVNGLKAVEATPPLSGVRPAHVDQGTRPWFTGLTRPRGSYWPRADRGIPVTLSHWYRCEPGSNTAVLRDNILYPCDKPKIQVISRKKLVPQHVLRLIFTLRD